MSRSLVRWLVLLSGLASFAGSQQNGRFATLKREALELFERGNYLELAGKLEEIWEQDQSDLKVAEYLAIGYLYGEHRMDKAAPLLRQAVAGGGQATFLVAHSHVGLKHSTGEIHYSCKGRISVSARKASFIADSGEHSMTIEAADFKGFRAAGDGRIQVRAAGQNVVFRVKSETREEADLLTGLVKQLAGNYPH